MTVVVSSWDTIVVVVAAVVGIVECRWWLVNGSLVFC